MQIELGLQNEELLIMNDSEFKSVFKIETEEDYNKVIYSVSIRPPTPWPIKKPIKQS